MVAVSNSTARPHRRYGQSEDRSVGWCILAGGVLVRRERIVAVFDKQVYDVDYTMLH
ncbi:MAG: hypothetical protein C5S45_02670 [Candidatus Methanocomedens sp.]|nr:MAG: hypothetical protein C5S45_02670 [ANME-2 cluster archaeon]